MDDANCLNEVSVFSISLSANWCNNLCYITMLYNPALRFFHKSIIQTSNLRLVLQRSYFRSCDFIWSFFFFFRMIQICQSLYLPTFTVALSMHIDELQLVLRTKSLCLIWKRKAIRLSGAALRSEPLKRGFNQSKALLTSCTDFIKPQSYCLSLSVWTSAALCLPPQTCFCLCHSLSLGPNRLDSQMCLTLTLSRYGLLWKNPTLLVSTGSSVHPISRHSCFIVSSDYKQRKVYCNNSWQVLILRSYVMCKILEVP